MEAANRLAAETSPYLLQHAGNPVAWLPWSEMSMALEAKLAVNPPACNDVVCTVPTSN